jgi:predicted  nucleic acid-binding Zn-ribbon protein
MNKLLKEIEELKNEIDSLFPSKEWDSKYLEKVKIDFTYQNNKIENNSISYGQIKCWDGIKYQKVELMEQ